MTEIELDIPPGMTGGNYFGRGQPAALRCAVAYQGPWETLHDGVQRAVRSHARALADTGIPVLLESFNRKVTLRTGEVTDALGGWMEDEVMEQVGQLLHVEATWLGPLIKHFVNGLGVEQLQGLIMPRKLTDCATYEEADAAATAWLRNVIAFTVWETTTVDEDVVALLSRCARNWTPSEQSRQALIASGMPADQVVVVPHPFHEGSDLVRCQRRATRPAPYAGLIDAQKRFYAIGKWEPRKGFDLALLGFLRAFAPRDSATLLLKTSSGDWRDYPSAPQVVASALADPAVQARGWTEATLAGHVKIVRGFVKEAEVLEMHYRSNIYLSTALGEGYGLPAFDAVVAGNRLVYVQDTGPQTFARPTDVAIVPEGTAPAPASYGWDGRHVQRVSVEAVAAALAAASPPAYGQLVGADARFRATEVGALMRREVLAAAPEVVRVCLADATRNAQGVA